MPVIKRGPKPKATAVKERNGSFNVNPGRRNKKEPKVQAKAPTMPGAVKANQVAAKVWRRVVKHHREMGILGQTDSELLELYSMTYADYCHYREIVNVDGCANEKGHQSPAYRALQQSMDRLMRLIPEMGFSPSSRTQLVANTTNDEDLLDAFMKAGSKN